MDSFTLPLPNEADVIKLVDVLIDPQNGDGPAHALIELITATANFENSEQANLANTIIDHAYQKTEHFHNQKQNGLREFIKNTASIKAESDSKQLQLIG